MLTLYAIVAACYLLALWGTLYTAHRMLFIPAPLFREREAPPVSILKPLAGADPGLLENLESFLHLDYPPGYEVIFFVASPKDPAVKVLQQLHDRNPSFRFRIVLSDTSAGLNPKVANLDRAWDLAKYDVVLCSDSNVRAPETYLRELVPLLVQDPQVGIVTAAVQCYDGSGLGGYLEEVMWNTYYARSIYLARFFCLPFVIGKTMLFRRSVAARFGGLSAFADHVAEDYMMGQGMESLGLSIEVAQAPAPQFVGEKSLKDYWARSYRWHVLQKWSAPIVYLLMPLQFPVVLAVLTGVAGSWWLGLAVFGAWWVLDQIQLWAMGSEPAVLSWVLAQLLSPVIWCHAFLARGVGWRGNKMKVGKGGWLQP